MHYSGLLIVGERTHAEPVEVVEPEPGVEFVVGPEENKGKQLRMTPCSYSNSFDLVISFGYYWVIYIISFVLHSCTYFYAFTFLALLYRCPCHL